MECHSADDVAGKLRKAVSDFGRKLLLLGPLGRRESIYDDADYLAFASLSTVLEGRWEVRSSRPRDEAHILELLGWRPAVVGITSTSPDHPQAIAVAKEVVKETGGRVMVIKGGAHEAHCSRTTIENHPEIDVSFAGEADITLPLFLEGHLPSGITYRDKGSIVSSVALLSQSELNSIPFPGASLLDRSLRWGLFSGKEVARLLTQRGCSYYCSFCASSGPMRQYDIDKVIAYLRELASAGFEAVFYEDSTFTLDRKRTMHLLDEIICSGIILPSGAQTRMDQLDPEMIQLMKRAGFTYVYPGVESFDDGVLKRINKHLRVETILKTIAELKKAGIRFGVPVARGFPGDSEEIFASTLRMLLELQPLYIFLEGAKIYPGTDWSRDFGELAVHKAYDRGIRETQKLRNPEDRGTLPFHDPSKESIRDKVREFTRAYRTTEKILGKKYNRLSAGCYRLKC